MAIHGNIFRVYNQQDCWKLCCVFPFGEKTSFGESTGKRASSGQHGNMLDIRIVIILMFLWPLKQNKLFHPCTSHLTGRYLGRFFGRAEGGCVIPSIQVPNHDDFSSPKWLVVWNMAGLWLSIILGIRWTTDELHHFSEGWRNHQHHGFWNHNCSIYCHNYDVLKHEVWLG